jgi:hypothetical protein
MLEERLGYVAGRLDHIVSLLFRTGVAPHQTANLLAVNRFWKGLRRRHFGGEIEGVNVLRRLGQPVAIPTQCQRGCLSIIPL